MSTGFPNADLQVVLLDEDEQRGGGLKRLIGDHGWPRGMGTVDLRVVPSAEEIEVLLARQNVAAVILRAREQDSLGLKWISQLRERRKQLPIVLIHTEAGTCFSDAACEAGVDDCIGPDELTAGTLVRSVQFAMERRLRLDAEGLLKDARADVAAAEVIHRRLLPSCAPEIQGMDIAGVCVPAETVGGDLFDFLAFNRHQCLGVVADVSGHGLPAAILMTELHGLLHGLIEQNFDLVRISDAANHCVLQASQSHQFITMLLYQLDQSRGVLSYVSAGHPGWILHEDETSDELECRQIPLGVDAGEVRYRMHEAQLRSGDILILPTDGIFEALGEQRQIFGIERMLGVIRNNRSRPAREIVSAVVAEIRDFVGGPHPADDCTLVVVKVF